MKKIFYLIFIVISIFFSGITFAKTMIIDNDAGWDDALAIIYLVQQKNINVTAITVAATGEAHCKPALKNTYTLLNALGKNDIPVACGREKPLNGNHEFPAWIRNDSDSLMGLTASLPTSQRPNNALNAKQLLIKAIQESKEPVDIVALGPLTNLAEVINLKNIKNKIRMIYIMGGAVHTAGNVALIAPETKNDKAEWNLYIDPIADDIVFRSGVPITLIPLDVTNKLPIDESFYGYLTGSRGQAAGRQLEAHTQLAKNIKNIFLKNKARMLEGGWDFWDPAAAFVAVNESQSFYIIEKLAVITTPDNESGALKIDNKNGAKVRISTHIDKNKFITLTFNSLLEQAQNNPG